MFERKPAWRVCPTIVLGSAWAMVPYVGWSVKASRLCTSLNVLFSWNDSLFHVFSSPFIRSALGSSLVKHAEMCHFKEGRPYLPQNIPDLYRVLIPWAFLGKTRHDYTGSGTQKTSQNTSLQETDCIFLLLRANVENREARSGLFAAGVFIKGLVGVDTEARAGVWV